MSNDYDPTGHVDANGKYHKSQYAADFENVRLRGGGDAGGGFLGGVSNLFAGGAIWLIIFGLVVYTAIFMTRQYGFYILPCAALYILLRMRLSLKIIAAALVAAALAILYGTFIYYPTVKEPAIFSSDYITSASTIYEKRNGGGKAVANVAEGEKVKVIGVTRDRTEFYIAAHTGARGWIPVAAFPDDAIHPADNVWDAVKGAVLPFMSNRMKLWRDRIGNRGNANTADRDWRNVIQKVALDYFGIETEVPDAEDGQYETIGWPYFGNLHGITSLGERSAIMVNHPFPATEVWQGDVREEVTLTVSYIMYMPEVTVVYIDSGETGLAHELTYSSEKDWFTSLVLKDIDSSETFPYWDIEASYGDDGNYGGTFYFFPPSKTRHFALTHEEPIKKKRSSIRSGVIWDIPEITIPANAPLRANDPAVIAQRRIQERIDNFTGNGSNAIAAAKNELYPEWTSEGMKTPITEIPKGEIVTILENRYGVIKVRYKEFEGYTNMQYYKQ